MITTLEGQKLPSHGELYQILSKPELKEQLYCLLCRRDFRNEVWAILKAILNCSDSLQSVLNYEFLDTFIWRPIKLAAEQNKWDIVLFRAVDGLSSYGYHNSPRPNVAYFCEYKSNVQEWGKEIDDFIRQIKERNQPRPVNVEIPKVVCLLSFDVRFEKYRAMLESQDIRLVVLPQDWLNTEV